MSFFGKCVLRIMPEQGNGFFLGTTAELVIMHCLVGFASGLCPTFRKYTRSCGICPRLGLFVSTSRDQRTVSSRHYLLFFFVLRRPCECRKHEFVLKKGKRLHGYDLISSKSGNLFLKLVWDDVILMVGLYCPLCVLRYGHGWS